MHGPLQDINPRLPRPEDDGTRRIAHRGADCRRNASHEPWSEAGRRAGVRSGAGASQARSAFDRATGRRRVRRRDVMKTPGPATPLILCNPVPLRTARTASAAYVLSNGQGTSGAADRSAGSDAVTMDGGQAKARLTIRADTSFEVDRGTPDSRGTWLRGLLWVRPRRAPPPALDVRIDDLQGRQVFVISDAGSLVRVLLLPGTYHVTVKLGALSRCYTMTLEQGAAVELQVPVRPIQAIP
jgi:hypothetical protein